MCQSGGSSDSLSKPSPLRRLCGDPLRHGPCGKMRMEIDSTRIVRRCWPRKSPTSRTNCYGPARARLSCAGRPSSEEQMTNVTWIGSRFSGHGRLLRYV